MKAMRFSSDVSIVEDQQSSKINESRQSISFFSSQMKFLAIAFSARMLCADRLPLYMCAYARAYDPNGSRNRTVIR